MNINTVNINTVNINTVNINTVNINTMNINITKDSIKKCFDNTTNLILDLDEDYFGRDDALDSCSLNHLDDFVLEYVFQNLTQDGSEWQSAKEIAEIWIGNGGCWDSEEYGADIQDDWDGDGDAYIDWINNECRDWCIDYVQILLNPIEALFGLNTK